MLWHISKCTPSLMAPRGFSLFSFLVIDRMVWQLQNSLNVEPEMRSPQQPVFYLFILDCEFYFYFFSCWLHTFLYFLLFFPFICISWRLITL